MVVIKKREAYVLSVMETASGDVYQLVGNSVSEMEAPWIVTCPNDIAAVKCK